MQPGLLILMESTKQPWGFLPFLFFFLPSHIGKAFFILCDRGSQWPLVTSLPSQGGAVVTYPTLPPHVESQHKTGQSLDHHLVALLFFLLPFLLARSFWCFFFYGGEWGNGGSANPKLFFWSVYSLHTYLGEQFLFPLYFFSVYLLYHFGGLSGFKENFSPGQTRGRIDKRYFFWWSFGGRGEAMGGGGSLPWHPLINYVFKLTYVCLY